MKGERCKAVTVTVDTSFSQLLPLVAVIIAVTTLAAPLTDNCSCLSTKVHLAR